MRLAVAILISLSVFLVQASTASADGTWTNADPDNELWSNAHNWAEHAVPSGGRVWIDMDSPNAPIVRSAVPQIGSLKIGLTSTGTLTIGSGGSLKVGAGARIGTNTGAAGIFNVDAGTFSVGTFVFVGDLGDGTLNMSDGVLSTLNPASTFTSSTPR